MPGGCIHDHWWLQPEVWCRLPEQVVLAVQDQGWQLASVALLHSALSRLLFYFPRQVILFHPFALYSQVGSTSGHSWGMGGLICCYSQSCDREGEKGLQRSLSCCFLYCIYPVSVTHFMLLLAAWGLGRNRLHNCWCITCTAEFNFTFEAPVLPWLEKKEAGLACLCL